MSINDWIRTKPVDDYWNESPSVNKAEFSIKSVTDYWNESPSVNQVNKWRNWDQISRRLLRWVPISKASKYSEIKCKSVNDYWNESQSVNKAELHPISKYLFKYSLRSSNKLQNQRIYEFRHVASLATSFCTLIVSNCLNEHAIDQLSQLPFNWLGWIRLWTLNIYWLIKINENSKCAADSSRLLLKVNRQSNSWKNFNQTWI